MTWAEAKKVMASVEPSGWEVDDRTCASHMSDRLYGRIGLPHPSHVYTIGDATELDLIDTKSSARYSSVEIKRPSHAVQRLVAENAGADHGDGLVILHNRFKMLHPNRLNLSHQLCNVKFLPAYEGDPSEGFHQPDFARKGGILLAVHPGWNEQGNGVQLDTVMNVSPLRVASYGRVSIILQRKLEGFTHKFAPVRPVQHWE